MPLLLKDEIAEPVCASETCSYYGKGFCNTCLNCPYCDENKEENQKGL